VIIATVAYDPVTGKWQFKVDKPRADGGFRRLWSNPMSHAVMEQVLQTEYYKRLAAAKHSEFYADSISVETLLETGAFNADITSYEPSHPRLVEAKKKAERQRMQALSVDELFAELNLSGEITDLGSRSDSITDDPGPKTPRKPQFSSRRIDETGESTPEEDRRASIHRARQAYRLWMTHGRKARMGELVLIGETGGFEWQDETGWNILMNDAGRVIANQKVESDARD
jgi:hypothetical protein